jgi:hypothetical protein
VPSFNARYPLVLVIAKLEAVPVGFVKGLAQAHHPCA